MTEYKQQAITLACQHGTEERCSIDAYVADNGLAYHKTHHVECNGLFWTVTHIKSGNALCQEAMQLKTPEQCERFITRIGSLHDWTLQKPMLNESVKQLIRRIARDVQSSSYTSVF